MFKFNIFATLCGRLLLLQAVNSARLIRLYFKNQRFSGCKDKWILKLSLSWVSSVDLIFHYFRVLIIIIFLKCTDCRDFFENCPNCMDFKRKCTDCPDFFFENCTDCTDWTDFFWKCTDFVRIFSKNVWATLHMVQYVALTRLTYDRGQFSLHSPVRGLIMTTPMARSDFLQYPA